MPSKREQSNKVAMYPDWKEHRVSTGETIKEKRLA
jgi:hypothetical protein